jgi:cytochrome c-type biogenesis protein CcmH
MKSSIVLAAVFLSLLFSISMNGLVFAQDTIPVTDDEVNEVAGDLYCPVCENIPLDVCPTQACAQWRDLIREKLEAGWTKEQIKEYFATQFGDRVLPEPPKRGINWLVYILPPAMILGGAVLLFWIVRGIQSPKEAKELMEDEFDGSSSGDEYFARIENELKNRKG